ncbi:helix-turn-helix domain-containing protein [Micromonospora halotolerans]|uniref:helix-turn-helix domain-containing protein n=1 Tax=Micromonospora halotolerans TaxID=709879 RepID=UPI00406BC7B3
MPITVDLPVLKNGRAKAVRLTTLAALCQALDGQPGDLLRWEMRPRTPRARRPGPPRPATRAPGAAASRFSTRSDVVLSAT